MRFIWRIFSEVILSSLLLHRIFSEVIESNNTNRYTEKSLSEELLDTVDSS